MNVEPDVLATADRSLPGEWAVQGERGLCLALLEDALNVALGKTPATPRERDEALEWIRSKSENPFGFARVCSELGLDHLEIRRKVERQLAARPEPATVADRQAPLPEKPEPEPHRPPGVSKRIRRRLLTRRKRCLICGSLLHGPWRARLPRAVPLGDDVQAVGTATFRFCTGCVTLFVEGTFVGEIRFGSRP